MCIPYAREEKKCIWKTSFSSSMEFVYLFVRVCLFLSSLNVSNIINRQSSLVVEEENIKSEKKCSCKSKMKENDAQTTTTYSHTKQIVSIIIIIIADAVVVVVIDAIISWRIMFMWLSLSHSHDMAKQRTHMDFFPFIIWLHNLLSKRRREQKKTDTFIHASTRCTHNYISRAAEETARNKHRRKRTISRAHISTNRNWPCVFMFRAGVYLYSSVHCIRTRWCALFVWCVGWMEQARAQYIQCVRVHTAQHMGK